jgi:hypothetical protein
MALKSGLRVVESAGLRRKSALPRRAVDAARETLYQRAAETRATDPAQEPPTVEQQRADALALVAETALHRSG